MIDPNTQPTGEEFESYNIRRWGSSSWTRHLRSEGRKDGAAFQNWKWWPNTLKAHQLIHYATKYHGVDTSQSNSVLFHAIYEEGLNVSLVDTLVQIGITRLGIPQTKREELQSYLENNVGAKDVLREIQHGRSKYNISGVPFFIVGKNNDDGKTTSTPYGFSGAQSTSTFLGVFEELTKEE